MAHILPAIIAETKEQLREKLDLVRGAVEWVQVDVMDGRFVAPKTWPYGDGAASDIKSLKKDLKIEAHLMVSEPERVIAGWISSGVDRVLVHYESTKEMGLIVDTLRGANLECGIAINLDTSIEVLEPWIQDLSVVQLMAIAEIGYHGRPFDAAVIPKLQALRLKYPELTIQIDGGLTIERAMEVAGLGANALVVGGALFNADDPRAALREFQENVSKVSL